MRSVPILLLLTGIACGCATVSKPEKYTPLPELGMRYSQLKWNTDKLLFSADVRNYDCSLYLWGPLIPILPGFILPRSQKVWSEARELSDKLQISVNLHEFTEDGKGRNAVLRKISLQLDGSAFPPEKIDGSIVTFPISTNKKSFKLTGIVLELDGKEYSIPEISFSFDSNTHFTIGFLDGKACY